MKSSFHVLAACVVVWVTGAQFVSAQAAPATPGPEHARLGYFVGNWKAEGETKAGPMGPGGHFTSSDKCEWFEGRFSVICRSEGKMSAGPSKSIGILGYSPEEKVYTYYGVDNSNMTMASVPRGTLRGNTWTYTDEGMMGGKKVKSRYTIKELTPTTYTATMEMQGGDGKWMEVMETKNSKAP